MPGLLVTARFCRTVVAMRDAPEDALPEVAFVGRSNSGKSTAINLLCNRRRLAFSSRTPGRTQALNFFALGPEDEAAAYLVDTPGYGYAQTPLEVKRQWQGLIGPYLRERRHLLGIVVMVDIRRGVGDLDRQLLAFAPAHAQVLALLTKADKLTYSERIAARREAAAALAQLRPAGGAEPLLFSALSRIGIEEAAAWVEARLAPQ
jgi:GTP-binding protein